MTARVGDTRGKTERLSGERAWAQPGWQRHGGHADAGYRLGRVRARARGRESVRGSRAPVWRSLHPVTKTCASQPAE